MRPSDHTQASYGFKAFKDGSTTGREFIQQDEFVVLFHCCRNHRELPMTEI